MSMVYVLMAPGFEEMELAITVDVLRRAGLDVRTVTLADRIEPVMGSRGIAMVPDLDFGRLEEDRCRALIMPGGLEGTRQMAADERVLALLRRVEAAGGLLAAICAAPTVLVAAGVGKAHRMTCHPGVKATLTAAAGVTYEDSRVVIDGRIITSQAPGTTFEFAYALVGALADRAKVQEIDQGVLALRGG
ncbi:MAG: DJ-1/PfpI family protein [Candidatus Riflebacteria bacterium]|nr:DJ-1/PfpI family protein [Candidatus Riflebacteria bacterium]